MYYICWGRAAYIPVYIIYTMMLYMVAGPGHWGFGLGPSLATSGRVMGEEKGGERVGGGRAEGGRGEVAEVMDGCRRWERGGEGGWTPGLSGCASQRPHEVLGIHPTPNPQPPSSLRGLHVAAPVTRTSLSMLLPPPPPRTPPRTSMYMMLFVKSSWRSRVAPLEDSNA